MAIGVGWLRDWLDELPAGCSVAIDEGGLRLIEVDGDNWLEIGGEPEEENDETTENL